MRTQAGGQHAASSSETRTAAARDKPRAVTVFHFIMPAKCKEAGPAFVWCCLIVWYAVAVFVEYRWMSTHFLTEFPGAPSNTQAIGATFLQAIGAIVVVHLIPSARRTLDEARKSLIHQIKCDQANERCKKSERDKKVCALVDEEGNHTCFIDDMIKGIFGDFGTEDGSIPWRRLLPLFAAWFAATDVITCWGAGLCGLWDSPIPLIPFRLTSMAVFYGLVILMGVYQIQTVRWLYKFSRQELRPVFTRSPLSGFRALGPILNMNLVAFLAIYIAGWGWSLLVSQRGMGFGIVPTEPVNVTWTALGALMWALWIPDALQRAMRASKRKIVRKHADKVEHAFYRFQTAVSQEKLRGNLEMFEWLRSHEYVVDRIPTSFLTKQQRFFFVAGTGAVIVAFWFFYMNNYNDITKDFVHSILPFLP